MGTELDVPRIESDGSVVVPWGGVDQDGLASYETRTFRKGDDGYDDALKEAQRDKALREEYERGR